MHSDIPDFTKARILVAGDLMLDRYWHGTTSRISPEAPVPVVGISEVEERAGGAGNVALNITALGGQSRLLSLTGNDEPASVLKSLLEKNNIDCHFVTVEGSSTVTKLRIISRQQQLIRLDFEDGFVNSDSRAIEEAFSQQLDQIDVVILSDYGKGTLDDVNRLILMAREKGQPVLVDPKGTDFNRYRNASVITPNLSEFEAVCGPCEDEAMLVEKGMAALAEYDLTALLITRGEHGMTLLHRDAEPFHLPTHAREVFDVTGAGDTVIATLAAGLAAGLDYPDATRLANHAAGVVVGKLGTATVTTRELQTAMLAHEPLRRGVVTESELERVLEKAREGGERIIMTNGCFDILHPGHVAYLSQARELGDRLIVAVNDDDSVKRLKGENRPINSLMQRMAVLSGLESVDWVVPFTEDTPERLICKVLPDALVKGGDYRPDQIAGAECVIENGGEVVIKQFIDGVSTTAIIDSIQKFR
jgi:D-beta-D-heptose 7-phosphate kinase/D-beta-D-heptose 1-phosphate adenosyltransferase